MSREEDAVNIATQPESLVKPFEPGADKSLAPRRTPSPVDVGCVDWYLYPVSRKPRQTESSRSGPRGGAAAPADGNHLA